MGTNLNVHVHADHGSVHGSVHADHGWERCAIDVLHCVAAALNAFHLWIHNNGMHVTGLGNAERGVSLVWEPGVCSDRGWEYLTNIIWPWVEYFVLLVILVGIYVLIMGGDIW